MAQTKDQKQKILEDLKEKIAKQKAIVFVDFTGLKVKDLFDLRKKLKTADCELKVAKKTLIGIAFKAADFKERSSSSLSAKNSAIDAEIKNLSGQIALIFGYKDEVSPAKIVWQFSQTNPNLKILGGLLTNIFFEAEKIIELAKLPTHEELLAGLVRSISAPISNLLNILEGNIKGLIYILKQIKV